MIHLLLSLLMPVAAWAAPSDYIIEIEDFAVDIVVEESGLLDITETIVYDFDEYESHGIYRSVPLRYRRDWYNDNLRVELLSVTDEAGDPYPVEEADPSDFNEPSGNKVWRIGSPAVEITGVHTYVIHYTVQDVIERYDDYDELYWNAVGTSWDVPIRDAQVTIHRPADSVVDYLPSVCYTGAYGESYQNCRVSEARDSVSIGITQELAAYEGLTAVVAFTPGSLVVPADSERFWKLVRDNWSLGLVIPVEVLLLFGLWFLRPPRAQRPLIPLYEAPRGIAPHMVELLDRGRMTDNTIAASMVELARQGHMHFVYDEVKKKVGVLKKMSEPGDADRVLGIVNTTVFAGKKEVVLASTILNKGKLIADIKSADVATFKQKQWYDGVLEKRASRYGGLIVVLVLLGLAGWWRGDATGQIHFTVTGIAIGLSALVCGFLRGRKQPLSQDGAELVREVEGFKWFLRVTEEERVKFTNAPRLTPQLFETFLPYAIAFGVEKEWVGQFKSILQDPPSWIEGAPHGYALWYPALLASTRIPSQFKSPPSNSGTRGSSGFSGGFSGGGFGGGGGGRW